MKGHEDKKVRSIVEYKRKGAIGSFLRYAQRKGERGWASPMTLDLHSFVSIPLSFSSFNTPYTYLFSTSFSRSFLLTLLRFSYFLSLLYLPFRLSLTDHLNTHHSHILLYSQQSPHYYTNPLRHSLFRVILFLFVFFSIFSGLPF